MSVGKRYLLDANVFIQAKNTYYGFDLCPGFWVTLVRQHRANRVCSIDKVRDELLEKHDDIRRWVRADVPRTFFKESASKKVIDTYRELVNWVQNEKQFIPRAKAEFSSVADGWLVAFAKVNRMIVVTHEELAPEIKRSVPIPNLCNEFDVDHCKTYEMLRDLNVQFVVKKRQRRT